MLGFRGCSFFYDLFRCKFGRIVAFLIVNIMETVCPLIQIIMALGILNVWLLRSNRATAYRGGSATDLKGEFTAYGLPTWSFYLVGGLKLLAAFLLLLGLLMPVLVMPSAALLTLLMLGAVLMHAKVKDPAIRYLPASLMLAMSIMVLCACWA